MSLWVPLLSVDKVRELGRITYEKDRGVVEDPIPSALICLQLDSETTGITSSVCRARLSTNRGETDGGFNPVAYSMEQLLRCDIAQIMSDLEIAVRAGTFGMDLMSDKLLIIQG